MANVQEGNVIRVDTSAAFPGVKRVRAIKYVGAASGTAAIRGDAVVGGDLLWEHTGNVLAFEEPEFTAPGGIYVAVTNSAVVYLYV